MSSGLLDTGLHGYQLPYTRLGPEYEASITSSAPSSQDSVFSNVSSAQSSVSSSASDDFRLSQEEARDRCSSQYLQQQAHAGHAIAQEQAKLHYSLYQQHAAKHVPLYADVTSVPTEQRQHPRRSSLVRNQRPPPLTRQCERKTNFVDNLVDSATQMVEVIWPLSVVACRSEAGGGRGVLPLRTYIEETLRRSRTSYSTLQVALYYLILIKTEIPRTDFTMEQTVDCPATRALMCGRRMFLSALILASKYLQDRNYSAKAWSKMSGLKVCEINTNERTFLSKVCWKLHIPELIYKRWTDIVLKYTPHPQPPSPGQRSNASWKSIVPLLTPELDNIPLPHSQQSSPLARCPVTLDFASPAITPTHSTSVMNPMHVNSRSHESTPTPLTVLPRFLEPKPDLQPPTPALARMGPLPTPQMTPSSLASNTPAANVCGSRRPSMCSVMSMAQKAGFTRCVMDTYPGMLPSRRPSTSSTSTRSSPESLISDRSRSSRASSISSISTVSTNPSLAPNARACLARQATCRNVRLPLPMQTRDAGLGSQNKPVIIGDDTEMCSSPEAADFTPHDKALHAPHRHSKHAPHHPPVPTPSAESSRKRARPRGGRRTGLQEEVRLMLEEELDVMDSMEIDEDSDEASPTPAAAYATNMLARSNSTMCTKEVQPPASLLRRESSRVPVQRNDLGKSMKRACCSTRAISPSPAVMFGEVA
ncbi:G1/S-specific cyclin pas1 [Teratosphaeria destructans]|uniref:G1/S-specific cyclin pas1 n=1 Tax=Teratosphaeria destructans TaxID=418781 RepID=A0A9W7SWX9_9PEZI|nr:G1/S-specific cyclin pas1 [Teratosphaeria destructans]